LLHSNIKVVMLKATDYGNNNNHYIIMHVSFLLEWMLCINI